MDTDAFESMRECVCIYLYLYLYIYIYICVCVLNISEHLQATRLARDVGTKNMSCGKCSPLILRLPLRLDRTGRSLAVCLLAEVCIASFLGRHTSMPCGEQADSLSGGQRMRSAESQRLWQDSTLPPCATG